MDQHVWRREGNENVCPGGFLFFVGKLSHHFTFIWLWQILPSEDPSIKNLGGMMSSYPIFLEDGRGWGEESTG